MTAALGHRLAGPSTSLRPPARAGLLATVLLVGVLGLWAGTTVIGGAVIAIGQTVVSGRPQPVQSLDGGVVAEMHAREGDRVTEGQVLLRFDPTLVRVNLAIAEARLADALALRARLDAEERGLPAPEFAYPALPFPLPDTRNQEAGQQQIFAARAALLQGRRDRLGETLAQIGSQLRGTDAQIAARRTQAGLVAEELDDAVGLNAKGLMRKSRVSELQRAASELDGQIAALEAERARLAIALQDSRLAVLQEENAFREAVATDLRAATARIEELTLEIVTRRAQLDRVEVRSPADGIVHQLQVAGPGEVVAPGARLLEVVPLGRGLDFELRVDPRAIDQVFPGQQVEVVLSSFDPRATPRLAGRITAVPPGAATDPQSGQQYFRVPLSIPPEELARLGGVSLMPGMPVEAYLETGDRTVLAYLLKPFTSQIARAFRED